MVTKIPVQAVGDRLDDILDRVSEGEEIILDQDGRRAVVIAETVYDELVRLRAETRRLAAGERLEALREQIVARNRDLTSDEADVIAQRAAREAIDDLAADGKVVFERLQRPSS